MDFDTFSALNRARCESEKGFNHRLNSWTLSDWMTATAGELGEAANVVKKLNRYRDGIRGNTESEHALHEKLKREIADTFIYLDLMAQAAGFSLGQAVAITFDEKSLTMGYPQMAGGSSGAFSVGEIVRYGDGPSAVMQLACFSNGRAYGENVFGGSVGCDRNDLRIAREEDLNLWVDNHDYRKAAASPATPLPDVAGGFRPGDGVAGAAGGADEALGHGVERIAGAVGITPEACLRHDGQPKRPSENPRLVPAAEALHDDAAPGAGEF